MRIQKSPKHIAKSLLKSSTKKLPLAVVSIFVLASGVLLAQNLTKPEAAMALTPPDSCFAFNTPTNAITDYYDNESNNPSNPACPRAVDIPSTIGGVEVKAITGPNGWTGAFKGKSIISVTIPDSVTSIGYGTFSRNQLSSVTIPNSVTSIGNAAFSNNQLTSVTIPNSVTSIGDLAFYENQLTSVTIPDSVTSIGTQVFERNHITTAYIGSGITELYPNTFNFQIDLTNWSGDKDAWIEDFYSDDPTLHQAALGAMFFTRVYTSDPSNPQGLQSTATFDCLEQDESTWDCLEWEVIDGHIINPANIEVSYISASGDELQPKHNFAGFANDAYISNYRVDQSPDLPPPAATWYTSPEELSAIDQAISSYYYRLGDQVTITPPAIPGYITPAAKTFTLSDPDTVGNFVYQPIEDNSGTNPGDGNTTPKPLTKVDFSAPSGSKSNPTAGSVPSNLPPAMANSTFSVDATKQCSSIDSAKLLPAGDFKSQAEGRTTLGGLAFILSCTEPGKDAKVSLTLASEVSDPSTIKVYKQTASGKVTTITKQTTITTQNNQTTITYNLTDGGELDDDGQVNGQITDPIFITVPADSELLAETGESQTVVLLASVVMTVVGSAILAVLLVRKFARTV